MFSLTYQLPNTVTFFADTGVWSSAIFTEYLPLAFLAVGISIGLILILFVINKLSKSFSFLGSGSSVAHAVPYDHNVTHRDSYLKHKHGGFSQSEIRSKENFIKDVFSGQNPRFTTHIDDIEQTRPAYSPSRRHAMSHAEESHAYASSNVHSQVEADKIMHG